MAVERFITRLAPTAEKRRQDKPHGDVHPMTSARGPPLCPFRAFLLRIEQFLVFLFRKGGFVMKKLMSAMALALLLVAPVPGAWAGEIEGKIQKIDSADRVLILEDGTQLWIPQDQSLETLKEGAIVKAVYEEKDGKKVVTSFKVSG